jgi:hypothetical protein
MSEAARACTHCGSSDIVTGVKVGPTAEVGEVGLRYRTKFLITGTEPLLADLCRQCGTVVRTWVKQTDRNWLRAQ